MSGTIFKNVTIFDRWAIAHPTLFGKTLLISKKLKGLVIYDLLLIIDYFSEVKLKISINDWGQYTENVDCP